MLKSLWAFGLGLAVIGLVLGCDKEESDKSPGQKVGLVDTSSFTNTVDDKGFHAKRKEAVGLFEKLLNA
jgi:hypothetical protein